MIYLLEAIVLLTCVHKAVAGPLRPRFTNSTISLESSTVALSRVSEYGSSSVSSSNGNGPETTLAAAQESQSRINPSRAYSTLGASDSYSTIAASSLVSVENGNTAYSVAASQTQHPTGTTTLTLTTTVPPEHHSNATTSSTTSSHPSSTLGGSAMGHPGPYSPVHSSSLESPLSRLSTTDPSGTSAVASAITTTTHLSSKASYALESSISSINTASGTIGNDENTNLASYAPRTSPSSESAHHDTATSTQHAQTSANIPLESSATTSVDTTTSHAFPYPDPSDRFSGSSSLATTSSGQQTAYASEATSSSVISSKVPASFSIADPVETGQHGSVNASPDGSSDSNESTSSKSQPTSTANDLPPIITGYPSSATKEPSTAKASSTTNDSSSSGAGPGITIVPIDPNMTTVTKTVTDPGWTVTVAKETVTVTVSP